MSTVRALINALPLLQGPFPPFAPDSAPREPSALFARWLEDAVAAGDTEPHVMTLSTVDPSGHSDARIVTLRDVYDDGWYFGTSRECATGKHLFTDPRVAVTFYWPRLGRQVRVRGLAEDAGDDAGEADYQGRGPGIKALAHINRQSHPLKDPAELDRVMRETMERLEEKPAPRSWRLYRVRAEKVEFWQAQTQGCPIRLRYRRVDSEWRTTRLWP